MKLYLGHQLDIRTREVKGEFHLPARDLVTHLFICGVTGSGKTVLGKSVVEEAALNGIPSIVIDLKGDLSSLSLAFPEGRGRDFVPWIDAGRGVDPVQQAAREAKAYKSGLGRFGISLNRVRQFRQRTQVTIYTPTSTKGVPLGLSSLPPVPPDALEVYEREPEALISMIDALTGALVQRLYPGVKAEKLESEQKLLYALVEYGWLHGLPLEGLDGLAELIRLVQDPPIETIGVLPLDSYISKRRREQLAVKINGLLVGAEKLWYQGQPLDIDALLHGDGNRTQVAIVNLTEIASFEDRNSVIAQIAYAIYNWMRRQGGSADPRLLFYIDEIGGGGGRQAIYPSFPYNPSSKPALNLLLRQGRAFGVGCILATQNPGDIDYRGLSNCGTWAIGRLATRRDRDKVREGLSEADIDAGQIHDLLATPQAGQFLVKQRDGDVALMQERWLMTHHRTVPTSDLPKLSGARERARKKPAVQSSPKPQRARSRPPAPRPSEPGADRLAHARGEPPRAEPTLQTVEEVYAGLRLGSAVPEPFVTIVEPLAALQALFAELATVGIKPGEVTIRAAMLLLARFAQAGWEIDKIRRDSQGRVRERIRESGTVQRHEAPTKLADKEVSALKSAASRGSERAWRDTAKRLRVVYPSRFRLTKSEIRREVAPLHGVPQRDVHVDLQPPLNVGYVYNLQLEYRGKRFPAEVDGLTGEVSLKFPVFSITEAKNKVRDQFPAVEAFEGKARDEGAAYRLRARAEDHVHDLTVNKHSCKVTDVRSRITEARALGIAREVAPSGPAFIGQKANQWLLVYDSGRLLAIDRESEAVIEGRHLDRASATATATAAATGHDPAAGLERVGFVPDWWRMHFRSDRRELEVYVNAAAETRCLVRPRPAWVHHLLAQAFPDSQFDEPRFHASAEAGPGTTYESFAAEIDGPRMSCTAVVQPSGEVQVVSKAVKREPAENEARDLLTSMGVGSPQVSAASYDDGWWRFAFRAPEGLFDVLCDDRGCQVPDLRLSKADAVQRAVMMLRTVSVREPGLREAVHRRGRWRIDFRDSKGEFRLHVGADQCRLVAQTLTEEGAMAFAARSVGGEAVSVRKSVLGLGRYWVVEVRTAGGLKRVKIDPSGRIV